MSCRTSLIYVIYIYTRSGITTTLPVSARDHDRYVIHIIRSTRTGLNILYHIADDIIPELFGSHGSGHGKVGKMSNGRTTDHQQYWHKRSKVQVQPNLYNNTYIIYLYTI